MPCSTIGIIIVFLYKGEKLLKNANKDMENAIFWMKGFCTYIYVFTDLPKDFKNTNQVEYIKTNNTKNIFNRLYSFFLLNNDIDHIVYYYSGHGVEGCMLTPNHEKTAFQLWKDFFLSNTKKSMILFIMDCCNPSDMNLPYILEKSKFKLIKNRKNDYTEREILLILSGEKTERSVATKSGSLFSNAFFSIITQMDSENQYQNIKKNIIEGKNPVSIEYNRNLSRFIRNISKEIRQKRSGIIQTISIYSSQYMDPVLWFWVGSTKNVIVYGMDDYISIKSIKY